MLYIQLHRQLLSRGSQISRCRHLPSFSLPPPSKKSHLRGCCRALSASSSSSSSSPSQTFSRRPASRNRRPISLTLPPPPALHPTNHQIPPHQHRRPLASTTTNIAAGTIRTTPNRLSTTRNFTQTSRLYTTQVAMPEWTATKVRETFLEYFKKNGHTFGLLVPPSDQPNKSTDLFVSQFRPHPSCPMPTLRCFSPMPA